MQLKINSKIAEILMIIASMAWGASYLLMKIGLDNLSPFNLITLRFFIAVSVMLILFHKNLKNVDKNIFFKGVISGLLLFAVFAVLVFGIRSTTASNAAFLASTTVVFVPIIDSFLKQIFPNKKILVSIFLVLIGLYLLLMKDKLVLDKGAIFSLTAAFSYALYIILLEKYTKNVNVIALSLIQFITVLILGALFTFFFEKPELPKTFISWQAVILLGVVCTGFCFTAQTVAQKYISAEKIGLIYSLEPVFAALFSFIFINEILLFKAYIGAALVFTGVVYSQLKPKQVTI